MSNYRLPQLRHRLVAGVLALSLVVLTAGAEASAQNAGTQTAGTQAADVQSSESGSTAASSNALGKTEALPDSPGASQQASNEAQQTSAPQESGGQPQQPAAAPEQKTPQRQEPVGTAAAGVGNTAGIAASKPAGVAIAPPKQRRVRQLVIKLGAIAGAGAALGAVVALSKGSPSKPPGAQ
jgi:hypothetical protein